MNMVIAHVMTTRFAGTNEPARLRRDLLTEHQYNMTGLPPVMVGIRSNIDYYVTPAAT